MVLFELGVLIVSLAVLSKSSSMVVENAVKLSKFFGISELAIGFLLLSVSTSLPELSVSIISSALGEGAIAAGNVFGSSIANILLILGLGAFLYGLKIGKAELKDISIILVLTTIISAYMIFNSTVRGKALGFEGGVILLLLFVLYAAYILRKKKFTQNGSMENPVAKKDALQAFLLFSVSILLVLLSSGFVVDSAVKLSQMLHVAESFIGATIIAIGTSLPELTIDLQAIRKKHYGLALGDAIGSNMTNITLVLGAAAIINPVSVMLPVFIAALLFAIIANTLLFYVSASEKEMGKKSGIIFLLVYAFYLIAIFWLQLGEIK